jgi:hypothetical protein
MRGPRVDFWETSLKATGVALAGASAVFAAAMVYSNRDGAPVAGVQHLAIVTKPPTPVVAERGANRRISIDDTPVGSIGKRRSSTALSGYEIIDASRESALLRAPEGRVMRVARGSRIAGLGGVLAIERRAAGWALVTEGGVIADRR